MAEIVVGRLLVASLHQAIADVLPMRLEFYEGWLHPAGLRDGRIGVAPLAAVLSFLRREGAAYHQIAGRAGQYAAEWMVAGLPPIHQAVLRVAPPGLRYRLVLRLASQMVRRTYGDSEVRVRWHRGRVTLEIGGSVFCAARERADEPLCDFYLAAVCRLLALFAMEADVRIEQCRASGTGPCVMSIVARRTGGSH